MDPNTTNTGSAVPSSPASAGDQSVSSSIPPAQNPLPKPDGVAPGATNGIPQPSPSTAATITPSATTGAQTSPPGIPPHMHKGKPMLWVIVLLIFAFFCGLLLAAWYFQTQLQRVSSDGQTTQTQVPVATQNNMIIGIDTQVELAESIASSGALMGYTIDLGNQIGKEFGATIEFKSMPGETLYTALDKKEVDVIVSPVTNIDAMPQQYELSESFFAEASPSATYYGIVFRKGDPNVVKINEIINSLRTQGVLGDLEEKWLE